MSLRRLTRWMLAVVGGLILLIATSAVVVQSAWFKERLRRIAVTRGSEVLNGQLSIGQLRGSLLHGVELSHVVFQQAAGPVLSAETVSVRYDWRLLIKRQFVFDDLVLTRPVIHVTQRADGWNVLHLVKPSKSPGPAPSLRFTKMTLVDATMSVEPAEQPARHIAGLNAALDLHYTPDQMDLTVASLTARDADTGWRIEQARGAFQNTKERLRGNLDLQSNAGAMSVTLTGTPQDGGGRVLAGTLVAGQLNLALPLARPTFTSDLTGRVTYQVVLSATPGAASPISFQVDAASASAAGYAARNVRGTGSYAEGILHLDVAADAYGASATAKGEWRTPAAARLPNTWALSGRFRDLDARKVPDNLQAPKLATRLAGRYDLSLVPNGWAVAVTMQKSAVEGAQIDAGTTVRAEAHDGQAPHYEARGHVTALDPGRLARPLDLAVLAQPRFKGSVSGDFHADGRGRGLNDHVLVADAALVDSTIGPTHVASAKVDVNLSARRLAIDFTGPFDHLTHEEAGLPSDTKTPFDLSGHAQARVVLHDVRAPLTVDTIDATGVVSLGASKVAGYDVDRAEVDATLTAGAATIRRLTVEGAELHATATGVVAFGDEGASNLTFQAEAGTLVTLGTRIGQSLAGAATLEAKITGPANHLSATGTLIGRDVKYGTSVAASTLNSTFSVDVVDRQWKDFTATAVSDASTLTLGGVDVPHMTAKTTYHADRLDVETTLEQKDRTLQVAGGLLLHPDHQEVHLQGLMISTAGVAWSLPSGQAATINYAKDRVDVAGLMLTRGEQRIRLDGALMVGDGKTAATDGLDLQIENVDIGDANKMMLGTLKLTGTATGQAHVTGTTSDPEITSKFSVVKGSVQGTTFDALSADATYRGDRLQLNATLDQQPGARLTAVGTIPLSFRAGAPDAADAPMDVRVESTPIDLGLFQVFTTEIGSLEGRGLFNVRVTGTANAPHVTGTAEVSKASFNVEATGIAYKEGAVRLRFDGEHVAIEQFVLQDDDQHELTAEGGLDLAGGRALRSVDVHVVMNDMHVLRNKLGEVGLDADLKVSGELQHLTITGQTNIERGRLEVDQVLQTFTSPTQDVNVAETSLADIPGIEKLDALDPKYSASKAAARAAVAAPESSPPAPVPAPASTGTIFDNATINVRVDIPDNLILRAQDIRVKTNSAGLGATNLTLGGSVDVTKAPGQNLAIVGGVSAVRGYYEFQGRRFDVLRDSEVRFRGEQPIDPALDVSAEREISGVTTQVRVTGTARQPAIRLSSSPPLDEGDVLSLIVFGQPMNQLGESQQLDLAARAGMFAASAVATPLSRSIGRALNLDLFEIRAAGEDGAGPSISLGRQVGSRLFIGLHQEFGRDDISAVSFEYRLSSLLRLVTSVAQGTQQIHGTRRTDPAGMDLIFVIRY